MQRFCFNILVLFRKAKFQINAILRHSLQFSKLQHITFLVINSVVDYEEVDQEEVDQDILKEAGEVIPNISFYDDDEIFFE